MPSDDPTTALFTDLALFLNPKSDHFREGGKEKRGDAYRIDHVNGFH